MAVVEDADGRGLVSVSDRGMVLDAIKGDAESEGPPPPLVESLGWPAFNGICW